MSLLKKHPRWAFTIIFIFLIFFVFSLTINQQILNAAEGINTQPNQSLQIFTFLSRWLPWRADIKELAGIAALKSGDPKLSLQWFDGITPQTPEGLFAVAEAHYQLGEFEQAQQQFSQIVQAGQQELIIYQRLAFLYHQKQEYLNELITLEKGLILDPANPQFRFSRILILSAENPPQALSELQALRALMPEPDAQIESLYAALSIAALQNIPSYQLTVAGQALAGLNEWHLAALAFENALYIAPHSSEALAWLAEARQQTDRVSEAQALLQKAVSQPTVSPMVHMLYGLYWQRQANYEQAVEQFRAAVLIDPNNPVWRSSLAQSYEQAGNINLALAYYQSAADLLPTNAQAWRTLAIFCVQNNINISENGLFAAFKAYKLEPDNPDSLDVIGRVMDALGRYEAAEQYYLEAIKLNSKVAQYHYHLAILYLKKNQPEFAYSYLQTVLQLEPTGPLGDQARRVIERYWP